MTPLDETEARSLLKDTLDDLWTAQGRPIPGSILKLTILMRAASMGREFNEKALKYPNFAAFVQNSGVVAVKFRQGTDILVAPREHADQLEREPTEREPRLFIRSDFWRAFVTFPVPVEVRAYLQEEDRVFHGSVADLPPGALVIDPIPPDLQLEWRRAFIDELGEASPLRSVRPHLISMAGFKEFARATRANPQLLARWNRFFVAKVNQYIQEWATRKGVREGVWSADRPITKGDAEKRARLYAILDRIPLQKLLEIRIPLAWLVGTESPPQGE